MIFASPDTETRLAGPDDYGEHQDGSLWISMAIVFEDGTRTRPKRIPVEVRSIPGGVACWPQVNDIPFPSGGKEATAVWYYLNGVPWHFNEDWDFSDSAGPDDSVFLHFDSAVVEL